MSGSEDTIHLVVEIDVDSSVRAGIADFQGQPHLFVSECLDLDDERRSRRLGETFFLVPIPAEAAAACVRDYTESEPPDGDPDWRRKQQQRWERWVAFKRSWLQPAEWALRARGNFRAVERARKRPVNFRWVPLRPERVSGEDMRTRLAHLEELWRAESVDLPETEAEDLPF
jgi:hypothetical protein